jgi:hypothetical protein
VRLAEGEKPRLNILRAAAAVLALDLASSSEIIAVNQGP